MCPIDESQRPADSTDTTQVPVSSADDTQTVEHATSATRSVPDEQATQAIPTAPPGASDTPAAAPEPGGDRTTRIPQMERTSADPDPVTTPIPEMRPDGSDPRFASPAPTAAPVDPHESSRERKKRLKREQRDAERGVAYHGEAHAAYGGMNLGAAIYGWLCAVGLTTILGTVAGAVVGLTVDTSGDPWQQITDAISGQGVTAAVVGGVIAVLCMFIGGYVAGRMSRFDGGRQGAGVWVFCLLSAAGVVGAMVLVAGRFDVGTWADPSGWSGTLWIALAAAAVVSLLVAVVGAKAGHRYHTKVDRLVEPGSGWRG